MVRRPAHDQRQGDLRLPAQAPGLAQALSHPTTLVPTLCVGTRLPTLCVAAVPDGRDAERRKKRSHAERGNERDHSMKRFLTIALFSTALVLTALAAEPDGWSTLKVPGAWEEVSTGRYARYDGFAWYRTFVKVPADWKGKDLELIFQQ